MKVDIADIERLVGEKLGRRGITAENRLFEDLGVESLDVLTIIGALEDRFDVSFDDDELETLETVRDFHSLLVAKL